MCSYMCRNQFEVYTLYNMQEMQDVSHREKHLSYLKNSLNQTLHESVYFDRNKTRSNLPFQMVLYVNLWLFPVWLLTIVLNFDAKYDNLTNVYKVITSATFLVYSILECLKLYLGYIGNLGGKIPELASCWLICMLIQFPLEIFLIFDRGILSHYSEIIINSFTICLLLLEIIMGMNALKNLASQRAKTFYLTRLCDTDNRY